MNAAASAGKDLPGDPGGPRFHVAPALVPEVEVVWEAFATGAEWRPYQQHPRWAEVERRGRRTAARAPWFFWAESEGELLLTAIGIRRGLPVPGRVFWEFTRGPLCADAAVLEAWLRWFFARAGKEPARVRVQPALRLQPDGDDVETLLERLGFVRRRALGGWTTLTVDLTPGAEAVLAGLRPATRRAIRKSERLGVTVGVEDDARGWETLARLQTELEGRQPVEHVDAETLGRISAHWLRGGEGGAVLVARKDGEPVAAGLVVVCDGRAYLPLIPRSQAHRDLPSSHLLVWEAMRWACARGCTTFDLVGYSMMARPGDALWGINQFKRGFAPLDRLERYVAVHEHATSPVIAAAAAGARRLETRLRRGSKETAS